MKTLIENHLNWTGSTVAKAVLDDWSNTIHQFKKIMPRDYARVLRERAEAEATSTNGAAQFPLNGGTAAPEPQLAGQPA